MQEMRGGQCPAGNLMDARFGWITPSLGGRTSELLVNTLVRGGGPAGEEGEASTAAGKGPLSAAAEGRPRLLGTGGGNNRPAPSNEKGER